MTKKLVVYILSGVGILAAYFLFSNLGKVGAFFQSVGAILRPFTVAFVFAYILNGPMMAFEKLFSFVDKKKEVSKIRRTLAIIAAWVAFFFMM